MKFEPQLVHINNNLMCAIDLKTTGNKAGKHDILNICILPLDSNFKGSSEITPFYMDFIPVRLENLDESCKAKKDEILSATLQGTHPWDAQDRFDEWFCRLELGVRKQIVPLCYDWVGKIPFIINWLGEEHFNHYFSKLYRDPLVVASYANDKSDADANAPLYPKYKFEYLCSVLNVETDRSKEVMQNCVILAELYKRMLRQQY